MQQQKVWLFDGLSHFYFKIRISIINLVLIYSRIICYGTYMCVYLFDSAMKSNEK